MQHVFWMKLLNCVLIVGILLVYQSIQQSRIQKETISSLTAELEQKQTVTTASTDSFAASSYEDGIYQGEAQGYGGKVVVELTITHGSFTDLHILSAEQEDTAYLEAASVLLETILEEQTTDVDGVSGATFSSNGILHATEDALRKAEKTT
ncbi:MAG: FMN-binding protein [Oscillospiraceae bacterium]|nr:FMN-binding protein [Oscillospiraceae bacterium]